MTAVDVAYLNASARLELPVADGTVHPAMSTMCFTCWKYIREKLDFTKKVNADKVAMPEVAEAMRSARRAAQRYELEQKRALATTRAAKLNCDVAEYDARKVAMAAKRKATMARNKQAAAQQVARANDTAAAAAYSLAGVACVAAPSPKRHKKSPP